MADIFQADRPDPLRRRLLERLPALGALAGAAVMPALTLASQASPLGLGPTPRQSLGPFYPVDWAGDADDDLVRVTGEAARALGQVAHVRGRVLDRSGRPLDGAGIEIWQCDANGVYRHPRDRGTRDPGFQGRGRTLAARDGGWAFRTIRPVPYTGRTPHIHFRVLAPDGRELVTQLYVAGEPANERDFLLNAVRDPRERERLIARFDPADRIEPGAVLANFEIVVG